MELRSGLAKWIADMLDFRDSMGFLRRKRENVMRRFDSYCCERHPGASVLTEEIVRGCSRPRRLAGLSPPCVTGRTR